MGKKSHKKDRKHNKKKRCRSSSSSTSLNNNSSDDNDWVEKDTKSGQILHQSKNEPDNWMDFICNSSKETIKKHNNKNEELENTKFRMEMPGQSNRELNPYWKNGGTGLPPNNPKKNQHKVFLKPKADDDDDKNRYKNYNHSHNSSNFNSHQAWRKHDRKNSKHEKEKSEGYIDRHKNNRAIKKKDSSSSHHSPKYYRYSNNEKNYSNDERIKKIETQSESSKEISGNPTVKNEESKSKLLSDAELNELAAKQIKAELMGNTSLAEELRNKLENARKFTKLIENKMPSESNLKDNVVLLTRTSSKGYSYPVTQSKSDKYDSRKKKRERVLTHEDGKRVRYFDDDDKYSLKSMFQKEMKNTAEDSNLEFVKLSRKVNSRDDEDDVFVDRASKKHSAKAAEREVKQAIKEHKKTEKILNSCCYCFDSDAMMKHLFITKGEKCYICLPSYKSLTEGHCLIVPIYHYACATDIDEDVWNEMQIYRKKLTTMFKNQDEDVVFFESAMQLHNMPHMVWNCVPVPLEIGDTAPIYFKKAILECETEWAMNKKVVDLSKKDVRKAVPKGLPYISVDFGMQGGYAHVIEDEKIFPKNFAEEIIGGMMDLEHNKWRKRQKEPIEEQLLKATTFLEIWKKYNTI
ncbi:CWF19-like protein 2 [Daktulosphaira vitifoliae]|uniref:CWF19-like protein 2 n=1 Tax=Daktulosphaira vitifoliae TaxID=58002 RepID=UPI0021AAD40F|nr:CWF19-like protein 2 [Daktulosphaira vitifoliae]